MLEILELFTQPRRSRPCCTVFTASTFVAPSWRPADNRYGCVQQEAKFPRGAGGARGDERLVRPRLRPHFRRRLRPRRCVPLVVGRGERALLARRGGGVSLARARRPGLALLAQPRLAAARAGALS